MRCVREKTEKFHLIINNQQLELAKYLSQELIDKQKNKEEKIEGIVNFCLDYLNQDIKENWRKKKNRTQMLLTLAENE